MKKMGIVEGLNKNYGGMKFFSIQSLLFMSALVGSAFVALKAFNIPNEVVGLSYILAGLMILYLQTYKKEGGN